jgi:uncharacterized protein
LLAEGLLDRSVEVCWHAGEPLTVPIGYYTELVCALEAALAGKVRVEYSVQTNGTLVTPEWCRFLRQQGIRVGVSLDGPKEIHDRHRRDRAGAGTFDRVMSGLRLLQSHGLTPYVIAVLHRQSLSDPERLFDFFQSTGVREVCFNIEEIEGANLASSLAFADCYDEAVRFFRRYFELVALTPGSHWLREYAYTLRRLCARSVHNAQTNPLEMITVAFDGSYSTLSPELIGCRLGDGSPLSLGNILFDPSVKQSVERARWLHRVAEGVDLCKRTCSYYDVCGGGAPSNKIAENGDFASTETLNCRLGVQAPVEAMLSLVRESALGDSALTNAGPPNGSFGDLRAKPA